MYERAGLAADGIVQQALSALGREALAGEASRA